jgi:hypothetical protein
MAVPEAPMDEDYFPTRRENQIRAAGEVFDVQPVTHPTGELTR